MYDNRSLTYLESEIDSTIQPHQHIHCRLAQDDTPYTILTLSLRAVPHQVAKPDTKLRTGKKGLVTNI